MNVLRFTLGLLLAAGLIVSAGPKALAAEEAGAPAAAKPKIKIDRALLAKVAAAQAEKAEEKAEVKKKSDDESEKKADEEPKVDQFALPEGGVKELLAFVQGLMNFKPKTREEVLQYRLRGMVAMKEAAEKIQKIATDEDKKLDGFGEIEPLLLYFRAQDREATEEDKGKLLDELKAYLTANSAPSNYAVTAARMLAANMEYGGNPTGAINVYRELGAILAKSSDEKLAKTGAQMEGAARRLGLIGQPLEISGTEMDGSKFDWAKLRGKVVLVDFWATWCGPCLRELPNVKKNYELYHDKGFEVVAISLDRDREALEKFLAEEQNPWVTLHDGDWSDNAVATYYGVMGIPTVILVDKEGKVLSTRARGDELGRLLAEQLGPVEEKPAAEEKSEEKPKDAEKDAAAKQE